MVYFSVNNVPATHESLKVANVGIKFANMVVKINPAKGSGISNTDPRITEMRNELNKILKSPGGADSKAPKVFELLKKYPGLIVTFPNNVHVRYAEKKSAKEVLKTDYRITKEKEADIRMDNGLKMNDKMIAIAKRNDVEQPRANWIYNEFMKKLNHCLRNNIFGDSALRSAAEEVEVSMQIKKQDVLVYMKYLIDLNPSVAQKIEAMEEAAHKEDKEFENIKKGAEAGARSKTQNTSDSSLLDHTNNKNSYDNTVSLKRLSILQILEIYWNDPSKIWTGI